VFYIVYSVGFIVITNPTPILQPFLSVNIKFDKKPSSHTILMYIFHLFLKTLHVSAVNSSQPS
jgi:hypothetical protein